MLENIFINNAVIGVASKDNSKVTANNIDLRNCKTGFVAFQKKNEYGPSVILNNRYSVYAIGKLTEIELGSKIVLKNKMEKPTTIRGYIRIIKKNEEWLESLKNKSKEKGIPLNELIKNNAIFTFNKNNS